MEINRSDLIDQMVEKYRYTKKSATESVDDVFNMILDNMRNGNEVSIYGFGTFGTIKRAQRSCPNPQTGETCIIPEHLVVRFKPGARMRKVVKLWEDDIKRGLV